MWGELRRLDDTEMAAVRDALFSHDGRELIQLMADLSMHRRPNATEAARRRAADLGWIAGRHAPIATPLGFKVGDSCRELVMWESRDRKLHEADRLDIMHERTF